MAPNLLQRDLTSTLRRSLVALCLVLLPSQIVASGGTSSTSDDETKQEWTQWRGPLRNGIAAEFEAPTEWPRELEEVWRLQVGDGHSSPLVADDVLYLFLRSDSGERLEARSFATGELLWEQGYDVEYEPISVAASHGKGPFSTPALAGDRIVTLGITGLLTAWSSRDGEILWQHESADFFDKPRPFYGHAASPMILGERVIAYLGGPGAGALMAFALADGALQWRLDGDGPAYGSVALIEAAGRPQLVTMSQRRLIGVAPSDGKLLWEMPFQVMFDSGSITPVYAGERLLISAGKVPLQAYEFVERDGRPTPVEVWENDEVHLDMSSPVPYQGRLYAFSEKKSGQAVAVDLASGEVVWAGPPRKGESAFVTIADDRLMNVYNTGEMEVFDLSDETPTLIGSYRVAEQEVWAHPAFVGDSVVIKARTELVRLRVRP